VNLLQLIKMGRVIDPRAADRVNDAEKVRNLLYRTETTGVTDPKPVSIFDFEGRPFISGMSDRSQAGETVTNINNVNLNRPVNLEGGQNYMFQNPGLLWANAPTEAKYINDFAQHLRGQYGKDPLYLPWRMGPGSADSSTMTGDVMLSYAQSALGKRDRNAVNKYIKENYIPDWYGLDDPRSMGQWNNLSASKRADFVNKFGNVGNVNQFGGLTTGEARAIVTEPFQYSAPDMRLQNVGLLSGQNVVPSNHSTYKAAVQGEGIGRLKEGDITPFDLDPTMKAKAGFAPYERNVDRANLTGDDRYSLQMNVVGGQITDKVLKNLEKAGVTAAGLATIGAAGAAPPEFLDRIYNPQNHKFIMNADGSISTHLMAAEMDRDGNWYVFPLIQEDADGNLNDYRNDFDTAMEKAITSGNFLPFGQNKDAALEFSKNYKQGTPLEDFNPMKPTTEQNMESMINTPRRSEVNPIRRNAALGLISDAFKLGKDVLNDMPNLKAFVKQAFGDVGFGAEVVGAEGREPVKVEGTLPIGDFIYGEAPEGLNELSYGFPMTDQQVLDAGLIGAGSAKPIISGAKAIGRGGKALLEGAPEVAGRMYENAMDAIGANRYAVPPGGNQVAQLAQRNEQGFYSAVEQAGLNLKRKSGPGQGYLNDIKNSANVTNEEIEFMRLDKFLQSKPNLTREEVQQYINRNKPKVEFKNLNISNEGNFDVPQYTKWTLPGSIYDDVELLIKAPNSQFKWYGKHYENEENVVGWVRGTGRTDADGKKVFLVEEVQSDLHQVGRDKGYAKYSDSKYKVVQNDMDQYDLVNSDGDVVDTFNSRTVAEEEAVDRTSWDLKGQAPDEAPFKDSWYKVAIKNAIDAAVKGGYDKIAFVDSAVQIERYKLSRVIKQVNVNTLDGSPDIRRITLIPTTGGVDNTINLTVNKEGVIQTGRIGDNRNMYKGKPLSAVVGKDLANKIMAGGEKNSISGLDLDIGGKGMKEWYDNKIPNYVKDYAKKRLNTKSGKTVINAGDQGDKEFLSIDLTEDLKSKVSQGQPLFSAAPIATGGLINQNKENNRKNARNLDTGLLF